MIRLYTACDDVVELLANSLKKLLAKSFLDALLDLGYIVAGTDILHLSLHDLNDYLSASQASCVQVLGNLFAERMMLSGFLVEVGHRLVDFKLDLDEDELVDRFRGAVHYVSTVMWC